MKRMHSARLKITEAFFLAPKAEKESAPGGALCTHCFPGGKAEASSAAGYFSPASSEVEMLCLTEVLY